MTDDFLRELDALAAGGAAGLVAVTKRLRQCEITEWQFLCADAGRTKPLPRHALLCGHSPASSPLDVAAEDVWRELSGSGRYYDGTFGPLPREGTLTLLGREVDFSQDQPAAAIGRQVVLCLRVFNAPSIPRAMPALARAVQRHFNDILLAHPVLLHPGLLAPVRHNAALSYMSVAHALAGSDFGALPRVNHYPRPAPDSLEPHLADLARHPCLKLGLGVSWHVSFDADKGRVRRGCKSLVEHMLAIPAAKARFLGSVMEMDELARPAGDSGRLPTPLFGQGASSPKEYEDRVRVIMSLARSVLSASGAGPTYAGVANTEEPDLEFLGDVRKRRETLLADPEFLGEVQASMIRRVFSMRADALNPQLVAERTDAVIHGLVAAGLSANGAHAAQFVLDACIGQGRIRRNDGKLPKAQMPNAMAFLQAIDAHGGFGSMSAAAGEIAPARSLLLRCVEAVRLHPAHNVPYREQWITALESFWTAKAMSHQISITRTSVVRRPPEQECNEPVSAPVPVARRRSLAV